MTSRASEMKPIKLDKITVSSDNVRHRDRDTHIDELADSISKHGLLQPVVVVEKTGDRYDLIIGQRRYLAHKRLLKAGKKTFDEIPALIIPRKDHVHARLLSLGENLHRVNLNRGDVMDTMKYLYDRLGKNVNKVARELGTSSQTVRNYLKLERAATDKMKNMIRAGNLRKADAERIIEASGNDEKTMNVLAKNIGNLTKPEKERLVEVAWQNPKASPEKLLKKAQKPRFKDRVVVDMTPAEYEALEQAASSAGRSREELAKLAILGWLQEEGYLAN